MPYKSNKDLPENVKSALPIRAQTIFRKAFNASHAGGMSEERSFKIAWGAVKNAGYSKGEGGNYKKMKKFAKSGEHCTIVKVMDEGDGEGIVYGWGMISKIDGEAYFDLGPIDEETGEHTPEHIPEEVMRKCSTEFMSKESTPNIDMHLQDAFGITKSQQLLEPGKIVHSLPLTDDLKKAFGITCNISGWIVGVRPPAGSLELFKQGVYKGFSIGGSGIKTEVEGDDS